MTTEWIVEELDDDGEIVDVTHFETAREAIAQVATLARCAWGLVRDTGVCNMIRSWAYVQNGDLPEYFTDAGGAELSRVPKRYVAELAAARRAR